MNLLKIPTGIHGNNEDGLVKNSLLRSGLPLTKRDHGNSFHQQQWNASADGRISAI